MEARGERESSFTKHIGGKQGKTRDKQEGQAQKTKNSCHMTRVAVELIRKGPEIDRASRRVAPHRGTKEGVSRRSPETAGGKKRKHAEKGQGTKGTRRKRAVPLYQIPYLGTPGWHGTKMVKAGSADVTLHTLDTSQGVIIAYHSGCVNIRSI